MSRQTRNAMGFLCVVSLVWFTHLVCISKINVFRKVERSAHNRYRNRSPSSYIGRFMQLYFDIHNSSASPATFLQSDLHSKSEPLSARHVPMSSAHYGHTLVSQQHAPRAPHTLDTKKFAYMVLCAEFHMDDRLMPSDSRDVYHLTFRQRASAESEFIVYSPGSTWTTARNELLRLARSKNVEYQYYIFLDEDLSRMIRGANPWQDFEDWLLRDSPSTAYMSHSVEWQRVSIGSVTTGVFEVDGILHAFHNSTLDYLLPYDPYMDSHSWYYSQFIMNTLISTFYPGPTGRMGWNLATFDGSKNQHTNEPKYTRAKDWATATRYMEQSVQWRLKFRQQDWNTSEPQIRPNMDILRNMTLRISK